MSEHSKELLDLHQVAELTEITFEEISGKRTSRRGAGGDDQIEVEPEYSLNVESREESPGFRIRLGIFVPLEIGEVRVTTVAYYDAEGFDGELTLPLLIEYANEVAVMSMLPYLRHAIADLTQRIFGPPLVMPIVRRGELSFSVDDDDERELPDLEGDK